MAPGLHGERRAVIAGIVLGEDEGLSDELRANFRASGLYHLLAVSGQNVALIAGGAILLVYLIGLSRFVGQIVALAAIGGYVLAVGWQPSVVRAGVAGALASLAWLASRPSDRWYFLLLGAALLLAWSPYSLLDAGFQLSFAAVGAIFVVVPRLQQTPGRVPGAALARRGRRGLRGVRARNGADPAHAVRSRSALLDPGERARCAGRRPAPRDRARHGDRGSGRAAAGCLARMGQRVAGRIPRRCARGWSAGCRMRPFPLVLRSRSPRSSSAPPIS